MFVKTRVASSREANRSWAELRYDVFPVMHEHAGNSLRRGHGAVPSVLLLGKVKGFRHSNQVRRPDTREGYTLN